MRSKRWLVLTMLAPALLSARPGIAQNALAADGAAGIASFAPLLEATTPAVVNVAVVAEAPAFPGGLENPLLEDPFFRRYFDVPENLDPLPRQGVGSGVIIDADRGLIVSNSHVVQGADNIVVTLTDRRQFEAEVVGADTETDIALLRIDADNLSAIEFGDSSELRVGDIVAAIGNPFGLGQTATVGIVSALGRAIGVEGYEDFIQTDASINPGNSGGALINLESRLMGINTAILAPAGGNVGIGFAIPSDMVREVVDQLLEYGEVRRGRLGIYIQDVTPGLAEALDLPVVEGALVTDVEEGSPAAAVGGLESGDIIVGVNGRAVATATDLRNEIGLIRLGETVALTLVRNGERGTVEIEIGAPDEIAAATDAAPAEEPPAVRLLEGAELANVNPQDPSFTGVDGVLVRQVRPGSLAWRRGLREGDVITAVNRQQAGTVAALNAVLESAELPVALLVVRDGRELYIVLQ